MEARKWGRRRVVVAVAVAVTATEGSTAGEEDGGGGGGGGSGRRARTGDTRGDIEGCGSGGGEGLLREWDESRGEASYFARSVHCPNLPSCFFSHFFFPLIPALLHRPQRAS